MYCRKCGNKIDIDSKFCPNCGEKVIESAPIEQQTTKKVLETGKGVKSYSISINRKHELFTTYKSLNLITSLIIFHIVYNLFASIYSFFAVSWLDASIAFAIYTMIGYYYLRIANITYGNYVSEDDAKKIENVMKTALILYVIYYIINFLLTIITPDIFNTEELESQYNFVVSGVIAFLIYNYFYNKTKILLTPEAETLSLKVETPKESKGKDILRIIAWGIVGFLVLIIILAVIFT